MDTIDYYNSCASIYYENTVDLEIDHIRDNFISKLPENAEVLDLGCGSGRDSLYFIEQGLDVTSLEGSYELAELASVHIGQDVLHMSYSHMDFNAVFDGVWACGSLSHSMEEEIPSIIQKIHDSLKVGGILFLSLKYGTYQGYENNLYYKEFRTKDIKKYIDEYTDFSILETFKTEDVRGTSFGKWLHIIVAKEKN